MFFQIICASFLSAGYPWVAQNLTRKEDIHKHKPIVKLSGNKQMVLRYYSVSPKIQAWYCVYCFDIW